MTRPATPLEPFSQPAGSPVAAPPCLTGRSTTGPLLGAGESRLFGRFQRLLEPADVRIVSDAATAPSRPWDVRMLDARLSRRVLLDGALGLGDAYVEGWWECDDIPELFSRLLARDLAGRLVDRHQLGTLIRQRLFNTHGRRAAFANGQDHYDRGNELFAAMLDARMTYTCAYWHPEPASNARAETAHVMTLEGAQESKLEMTCRKIGLKAGDRVLDIGCGWGSFAKYAAERHGAQVVGITVAREQVAYATKSCRGLPCEFRLQDYRDVPATGERFDHVVSLGMFEHVGARNYRTYMHAVARILKPGGLFLLHTICGRRSQPNTIDNEISWLDRHIFPGLCIPSLAQVGRAVDGLFIVEDLHNIGSNYEPTLRAWFENFDRHWPELRGRYGERAERFYRLWKYYLQTAAGAFRCRKYGVCQIVLSPSGISGGYDRPR